MASGQVLDLVRTSETGVSVTSAESVFMPVMSMDVALARREQIVEFTRRIMVADQDFGIIPGTKKPSLLKPGAEKLCSFFGLEPEFLPIVEDCDWTGDLHKGEPFFYVRYRCRLLRGDRVLGVGEGSCNSWESKYRWRDGKRKCPSCGGETLIKGKPEYERDERFKGGMLCFEKRGGCGAKFVPGDPAIDSQVVGRVPNPDIADVVNTIQKMAQKRALVAATLIATSASEFFTQDVEDGGDIDTGGHPNGTQAAADHVRDQKIAQAKQNTPPVATAPAASNRGAGESQSGGSPMPPGGAPPSPDGLAADLPIPVKEMWLRMGTSKEKIMDEIQGLRSSMWELTGASAPTEYDRIVKEFGDPIAKVTFARRVVLELWKRIQEIHAEQLRAAEPQPEGQGSMFAKEEAYAD